MELSQEQELSLLLSVGAFVMLALGISLVYFYTRARKKLIKEAIKNQRLLLETTILTQERERKRIAADLHDEIGAKLNIIHLSMQRLKTSPNLDAPSLDLAKSTIQLVNDAIDRTRNIAHDLLPPILEEFGLQQALVELKDNYEKTGSLKVNIGLEGFHSATLGSMVELNIFRIIQELINNSIKHGKAKEIDIDLRVKDQIVGFSYQDDGSGFSEKNQEKNGAGLGFKNIESRLQMLKGKWDYESKPNEGFKAIFSKIPLYEYH